MSLTIALQFPTGRYVAATRESKNSVEWPPHPARLCLGLLDCLHKAGNPQPERSALLWLCRQSAPEIYVPPTDEAFEQILDGVYVPQNHIASGTLSSSRKSRSFPVVYLDTDMPTVFFRWPTIDRETLDLASLNKLIGHLPRLGHSSSLVIASALLDETTLSLSERRFTSIDSTGSVTASNMIRVPWNGIVEAAEKAFDAEGRQAEKELLIANAKPVASRLYNPAASPRARHDPPHEWVGYTESLPDTLPSTPWSPNLLVLKHIGGTKLGIQSTWQITETLHKTILDRCGRNGISIPSWVSGHTENGEPVKNCHLSVFPLPSIGHKHSDGHLMGLGVALPDFGFAGKDKQVFTKEWRDVLRCLLDENGELELVPQDKSWSINLAPLNEPMPPANLKPHRWTRPSKIWQTVTPIILNRHPKPHFKKDPVRWRESCESIIRQSCSHLDLPEPISVNASLSTPVGGAPASNQFKAPKARSGRPARFHIHACIEFPEPVVGPLLLGAGRYRGYGLLIPVNPKK